MNQSDKYYLKQGKLELSMLEDEEDSFDNLEFGPTGKDRESHLKSQQKLKINKEISHTLHAMGQLLVKTEQVTAFPSESREERLESLSISKSDQITELNKEVKLGAIKGKKEIEPVLPLEECLKASGVNMSEECIGCYKGKDESLSLDQEHIDNLLRSYFKPKEVKNTSIDELKQHIEKQIKRIENYQ